MNIQLDSCRICLGQEVSMNIFEEQNSIPINQKIVYCASVQISQDDLLPKMICGQCLFYLNIAYAFKIECESSDKKLRNILLEFDKKINEDNAEFIICDVKNGYHQALSQQMEWNSNNKIVQHSQFDFESTEESIVNSNDLNMYTESLQANYDCDKRNVNIKVPENLKLNTLGECNTSDRAKNSSKDKVGRHIAKKITGKLPQKLLQSIVKIDHNKVQIYESKPNNRMVLKDENLACKSDEDNISNLEEVLESNMPMVVSEEIVITDNIPCSIKNEIEDNHDRQENTAEINCENQYANVSSDNDKLVDKNLKIKLKMTLRRNNRVVNVFKDRFTNASPKLKVAVKGKLKRHSKSLKGALSNKKIKEEFKCDICTKLFPFRSHLKRHLNMHTGAKFYSCEHCKQKFVNKYNLSVHMSKHTGEFPLKCEICNKGLPNPSLLKRHMTSHSGEQQFQCHYCNVKFRQSSSLRTHEKMHLHRPTYQCDICFKIFSYTNSLAAHKKLHFGAQRFSCDVCLSTFSRKSSLVRHMEEHTKSKRIKCKLCNLSFYSKANYNSHLKTHCKYKCEICGEGFRYKNNFLGHFKSHKDK